MKSQFPLIAWTLPLALAGCAGPLGSPLGLGPGLDQIAGIVIFCILVAIAYSLIRNQLTDRRQMHHTDAPQEIARERYARGQITYEEFQRIMRHLSESQGDSA